MLAFLVIVGFSVIIGASIALYLGIRYKERKEKEGRKSK